MLYAMRCLLLLLLSTLFLLQCALAQDFTAAKSLKKGSVPPTIARRQSRNNDGCPDGWAECSLTTCYPLDGSQCCDNGEYCDAGYMCVSDPTGSTGCRARAGGGAFSNAPVGGGAALAGLLGVAMVYMG